MRIISKVHDFYDAGMSYGHTDNAYVFNRASESMKTEGKEAEELASFMFKDNDILSRKANSIRMRRNNHGCSYLSDFGKHGMIVFCGTVYPFISFTLRPAWLSNFNGASECKEIIEACGEKIDQSTYRATFYDAKTATRFLKRLADANLFKYGMTSGDYLDSWLEYVEVVFENAEAPLVSEVAKEFCIKFKTPYFVAGEFDHSYTYGTTGLVECNPILKHYQFQKNIDANTAYQEISMFFCGVLGNIEKEMVNISDKDMRDAKGFNNMSFKKEPGGKKRRKNK